MFTQFNSDINAKMHFQIFKMLLLASNTVCLFLYAFMHFIFFDFPVEVADEVIILAKLVVVASSFALLISILIALADVVDFFILRRKKIEIPNYPKTVSVAIVAIVLMLYACKQPMNSGIKKDVHTGPSVSYSCMEPAKTFLVMNNFVFGVIFQID